MSDELSLRNDIYGKDRAYFKVLMFLPCLFALFKTLNNDIWFLLNHGRYVIQNGIPHAEPFTIHEGFEFVMQQWLSAVLFWVTYASFGEMGLKILVMLCSAGIILVFYKLCMMLSDNYFFLSFVLTLFGGVLLSTFMETRPYIFSSFIIICEIYFIEKYIIDKEVRYLYVLPVLSLFLINLHAAIWLMLLVILVPYILDSFTYKFGIIEGHGFWSKHLFIAGFLVIVAGIINPYGLKAMTYIFRSYGFQEISFVSEMQGPNINTNIGKLIFGSLFLYVFAHIIHKKGNTKLRYILLGLGTSYLTISSIRSFLFFIICAIPTLAYLLSNLKFPIKDTVKIRKLVVLRILLICSIVSLVSIIIYNMNKTHDEAVNDYEHLGKVIQVIKDTNINSTIVLYTGYNDGGMAEYLGLSPYIDSRAEVFVKKNNKKEDVMKEYVTLQQGLLDYREFLKKYQFTHLIVTKYDLLYFNLKYDENYEMIYEDNYYYLFMQI